MYKLKRVIMQNLPEHQAPVTLDRLVQNVHDDLQDLGIWESREFFERSLQELKREQDLVIFSNGNVIATRKGLLNYE